jgi:glycine cleavage system H protein
MSQIPADRQYTDTHLWFQKTGEQEGFLGITDHAQSMLGDLISVELPRVGSHLSHGDTLAYMEGVLAGIELEAPTQLLLLEVNPRLEIHPDVVNNSPYKNGWLAKVRLQGLVRWIDAPAYGEYLRSGILPEGA